MTTQTEPQPNHFQAVEIDTTTFELEIPESGATLNLHPIVMSITDMSMSVSYDLHASPDQAIELAYALLAKALQVKDLQAKGFQA